jgi:hypothetical protein
MQGMLNSKLQEEEQRKDPELCMSYVFVLLVPSLLIIKMNEIQGNRIQFKYIWALF